MFKKIIEKVKQYGSTILAILIIIAIIVPLVLILIYLRKNNQTIEIIPKVKIKSITNKNNIDQNVLKDAINVSENILKRMNL